MKGWGIIFVRQVLEGFSEGAADQSREIKVERAGGGGMDSVHLATPQT